LLNGAALYPFDLRKEGVDRLADWMIQEEITNYHSTPTAFRRLASALTGKEKFPLLRLIELGGEPVYKEDVELYKQHFSQDCFLVNNFGVREAGFIACYFVDRETPITTSTVPAGYPVEDVEIRLLDDAGNQVDPGCAGEIVVKSRYLRLGYWQRPELTEAAFRADPKVGEERIYHTGDLGLMRPDGCLVHLGRKDSQVKIRGYRVDPSQIEEALLNLDNIREAAVVVWEEESEGRRLGAHIVPAAKPAPTISALRGALAEKLPDYMVPSTFVFLEALPVTPMGKVDRRALPAPGRERPELESPFVAPRNPTEDTLAKIWSQVLGLDQVGIDDPFLELGGNSLQATQIVSRVIKTFQVEVSLQSFFQAPTVADTAALIVLKQTMKAETEDVEHMPAEAEALSAEGAKRIPADEG
jgi:acyl-coenzyme A synthetase/AMP-(fatty) acid ligase/acyl carrier protein